MCLHYVKKYSKSDSTDRLEPAGNGCNMSELNLEPARHIYYWKVSTKQLVRVIDSRKSTAAENSDSE